MKQTITARFSSRDEARIAQARLRIQLPKDSVELIDRGPPPSVFARFRDFFRPVEDTDQQPTFPHNYVLTAHVDDDRVPAVLGVIATFDSAKLDP